jgi:alanine racemase
MNRSVRIADVAREAGVSTTAVSFAFNNPHRLNPQTVTRILDVARRLGYAPSPHARALLSRTVGVIGVLVPQSIPSIFANPFFSAFYEGVGQVCEENGLSLLTVSPLAGSLYKAVANAPVDGFIVVGLNETHEDIEVLNKRNIPFVIVDGDAIKGPSVNIDDEHGAWLAADYLLRHGHRNILCMHFEVDYTASPERIYGLGLRRLNGYRRAFEAHNIGWNDHDIVPTPINVSGGADNFIAVWNSNRPHPTAVMAVSDVMAIGVIRAAKTIGLRIPEDLSIIGYDDIPLASWTNPALTTIRQPIVEKGETAAQLLLNVISGDTSAPKIVLPTELVIRSSVSYASGVNKNNPIKGGEAG